MIKTHSEDPDVHAAAQSALVAVREVLASLPQADSFDYGGHILKIGEYNVCETCTRPIAEAQQAEKALLQKAHETTDDVVKEHLVLAAGLLKHEAEAAIARADLHNGIGTEPILNDLLRFQYERGIHDDYQHSHHQGA